MSQSVASRTTFDPEKLVRTAIHHLPLYTREEPPVEKPARVVRLDWNESPYGPSPRALEALAAVATHNRYPEFDAWALRDAIGRYAGVPADRIVAGAGLDNVLETLMLLLIEHGDRVIISEPTFMVYQLLVRGHGGEAVNVPLDRDFQLDAQGILDAVDDRTKLIVICNPNNPTGNLLAPEAIEQHRGQCTLPGGHRRGVRRVRRRELPRTDGRVPESGGSAHVEQVRRPGRYACRLRHFSRVADAVPDARHAGVLQRQRGCQRRRDRRPRGRRLQPGHHRPHRRRSGDACRSTASDPGGGAASLGHELPARPASGPGCGTCCPRAGEPRRLRAPFRQSGVRYRGLPPRLDRHTGGQRDLRRRSSRRFWRRRSQRRDRDRGAGRSTAGAHREIDPRDANRRERRSRRRPRDSQRRACRFSTTCWTRSAATESSVSR